MSGKGLEKILVIDDEPGMCRLLETVLGGEGYRVSSHEKPEEAIASLPGGGFALVVTDVRMPKIQGTEVLAAVRAFSSDLPVILITAHGTVESAVEAMKRGAVDFVMKPFKNDEIRRAVANALEKPRLREENRRLKEELASRYAFGAMVGRSAPMRALFDLVSRLAEGDATVLILGESGTGKELVARALHFNGARRSAPFMALHCGAMPEALMESELFGSVKGAFTDARADRTGLLESAQGGTVFLDEVGDMPAALQVKLLRFLQEKEVRPVGGAASRKVDVRIVAATNKDLKGEVEAGRFRQDLYYRLAVVPVTLPPLRERPEDVPPLLEHFLARSGGKAGRKDLSFGPAALRMLLDHSWPGNVRELENAVEHAVALSTGPLLTPEVLPQNVAGGLSDGLVSAGELAYRDAKRKVMDAFEKTYLRALLLKASGNVTRAAELADMDRKNFQDLFKKHGIEPSEFSQRPR